MQHHALTTPSILQQMLFDRPTFPLNFPLASPPLPGQPSSCVTGCANTPQLVRRVCLPLKSAVKPLCPLSPCDAPQAVT